MDEEFYPIFESFYNIEDFAVRFSWDPFVERPPGDLLRASMKGMIDDAAAALESVGQNW